MDWKILCVPGSHMMTTIPLCTPDELSYSNLFWVLWSEHGEGDFPCPWSQFPDLRIWHLDKCVTKSWIMHFIVEWLKEWHSFSQCMDWPTGKELQEAGREKDMWPSSWIYSRDCMKNVIRPLLEEKAPRILKLLSILDPGKNRLTRMSWDSEILPFIQTVQKLDILPLHRLVFLTIACRICDWIQAKLSLDSLFDPPLPFFVAKK